MKETFYTADRLEWRQWLTDNFETKDEIWFVFPTMASGEDSISYNDAVEEALCFSLPYKRIRVAYIDDARTRPEEFQKRLNSFIIKTRENKLITGYGGIGKYYK